MANERRDKEMIEFFEEAEKRFGPFKGLMKLRLKIAKKLSGWLDRLEEKSTEAS